ncbi:MAG: homoserine dehydrogenase [Magnetococcales bacterium]|nr:homoserine dehydrogenase [Magnetococcales bacterium]
MEELRIGILGFGTVGRGVVTMLQEHGDEIIKRSGVRLRLVRIATRTPSRDRGVDLGDVELTNDVYRVVNGDDIDVVVELIGGYDPAEALVRDALNSGKHVVTANKALIAERGVGLLDLAANKGLELSFEAAVAGAVPIVKAMKESLAADPVERIYGILNGTCNYILTEMREKGLSFESVLADAQEKGFAEADPTFDVEGIDAAHKLAILAAIAFGTPPNFSGIHIEGINHISDVDIAWAMEMGYRIKLLGIAKRLEGGVELRVQPTLVPESSMVASVEGVFNSVFVRSAYAGTTMYHGRGAGEKPTASAVVADLLEIARNQSAGAKCRVAGLSVLTKHLKPLPVLDMAELSGEYYLRLAVLDRPGVLADVTTVLARYDISIDAIRQKGRSQKDAVPLVIVTHKTTEQRIQSGLKALEALESVREKPRFIRIETGFA